MATFTGVFDHMRAASSKLNHEAMYRAKLIGEGEMEIKGDNTRAREIECIEQTEMNILAGLELPAKFVQTGAHVNGFNIDMAAVAKFDGPGLTEKCNVSRVNLQVSGTPIISLCSGGSGVTYSKSREAIVANDPVIMSRLQNACPNLCEDEAADLMLLCATDYLTTPSDMRHILTKAYLNLCDLTLGTTGDCDDWEVADGIQSVHHSYVRGNDLPSLIANYRIVVSDDGLTQEEMDILWLSSGQYPMVKFGGDNVYNSISMKADKVAIVSKRKLTVEMRTSWDPEAMYRAIVGLCTKMGCLDDWFWVVKHMRGRPHLLGKIASHTGESAFSYDVPLSFSMDRALGEPHMVRSVSTHMPGYLSTSAALVADAMLAEAAYTSLTMVVEELGAYGTALYPGSCSDTRMYSSMLRDYGTGTSGRTNIMLQSMEAVFGSDTYFGFRDSLTKLARALVPLMRDGRDGAIPQMCFEVGYTPTKNTTWGASKGGAVLTGFSLRGTVDQRELAEKQTAVMMWLAGVRERRPHVGANMSKRLEDARSKKERVFLGGATGRLTVGWVTYSLSDDVQYGGDYAEHEFQAIYASAFKGGRATVTFTEGLNWSVEEIMPPDAEPNLTTTFTQVALATPAHNEQRPEKLEGVTYGGSVIRGSTPTPKVSSASVLGKLRVGALSVNPGKYGRAGYNDVKSSSGELLGVRTGLKTLPDKCNVEVIPTPGDGKCGIHALVNGMALTGMVEAGAKRAMFDRLDRISNDTRLHDDETLGALGEELGVRVRIIEDLGDGTAGVREYNSGRDELVEVHHKDGHYSTALTTPGEGTRFVQRVELEAPKDKLTYVNADWLVGRK